MKEIPEGYVLICPHCKTPAKTTVTTLSCDRCGGFWPRGKGYEEYGKKKVLAKPAGRDYS